MSQMLKISEAASIGIHAMIFIAEAEGRPVNTKAIAAGFDVSENHTAKVLQRLTHAGYISAIRGPKGGFILNRKTSEITILEIYEAIDGPLSETKCFFMKKKCSPCCGLFGEMMQEANEVVRKHFGPATLQTILDKKRYINKSSEHSSMGRN
jgi:Rrf2 family protein